MMIWSPGFNPSFAAAVSGRMAATNIPTAFPPATWMPTLPVLWKEMTRAFGLETNQVKKIITFS